MSYNGSGTFSINSAVTVSSGGTLALGGSSNLSEIANLSGAVGGIVNLGSENIFHFEGIRSFEYVFTLNLLPLS